MGSVYLGRAPDGRAVAIKVLTGVGEDAFARFDRERRVLVELGDASFVPLEDSGFDSSGAFIVMPFLEGGTLRARIERGPLPVEDALAIARRLAAALGAAHAKGILHRDLKPENVLFDAAGVPRVADLGLAKHLDSSSYGLSKTGDLRGTAGYMPAEQMADAKSVGPEADVFALGAIAYEMLAGRPAFHGESLIDVMGRVELGKFTPLAQLRPETPRWVRRVIERALARDPARRFADGAALAEALAHPPSAVPSVIAAGLAVALLLAAAVLLVLLRGTGDKGPAKPEAVTPVASAAPVAGPRVEPRASGSKLALAATWGKRAWKMNGAVHSIAFSFDGKRLATGSYFGSVTVWDAATGAELWTFRAHPKPVAALAFSPDDRLLLTSGHEATIALWSLDSKKLVWRSAEQGAYALGFVETGAAFMAVGEKSVVARSTDDASLVRRVSGVTNHHLTMTFKTGRFAVANTEAIRSYDAVGAGVLVIDRKGVSALALPPDGGRVFAGGQDGSVTVFDAQHGAKLGSYPGEDGAVTALAFLPDRNGVAVASAHGSVRGIDLGTGQTFFKSERGFEAQCATFAPGVDRVAIGGTSGQVTVHALRGKATDVEGHAGVVASVAASPDGETVASVGADGTLRLWDPRTGTERRRISRGAPLWALAWSPDGRSLAAGGDAKTIDLFTAGGDLVASYSGHAGAVRSLAFTRDGKALVSGSLDRSVRLWSLEGKELRRLGDHKDAVIAVAASPRSELAVSASYDRTLKVWDPRRTGSVATLEGHQHWVVAAAFAPDGRHAASGSWDARFGWWDLDAGKLLWKKEAGDWVTSVAVSPDGRFVAAGSVDRSIRYHRTDDPERSVRVSLEDREDFATALDFSPDGGSLYVGTARGVIERYETRE